VLVTGTFTAAFAGVTELTVSGVLTGTLDDDVVNPLVNACTAFPARSVKPLAVSVYTVFTVSGADGVNLSRLPLTVTVPATALLPVFSVRALLPTLTTLKAALAWTSITAFTGTFVAPFGGVTDVTVSGPASARPPWRNTISSSRSAPVPDPADP